MSRSFFWERLRINAEIACESFGDFLSGPGSGLKKPLFFLVGTALIMTLRSARSGIQSVKRGGYASNSRFPKYKAAASAYKPYTGTTSRSATGYNAAGSRPLGQSSYSPMGKSYGSGFTKSLAELADAHPAARVVDASAFRDYGGIDAFSGQVETLQAYEGAGVVEKVLQSPGNNKVLVVDGGGNMHSAVFGKTAATYAKNNGWKGVIIQGVLREARDVQNIQIGVKALGAYPVRGKATSGSKGSALTIAGMQISPGMYVFADKVRRNQGMVCWNPNQWFTLHFDTSSWVVENPPDNCFLSSSFVVVSLSSLSLLSTRLLSHFRMVSLSVTKICRLHRLPTLANLDSLVVWVALLRWVVRAPAVQSEVRLWVPEWPTRSVEQEDMVPVDTVNKQPPVDMLVHRDNPVDMASKQEPLEATDMAVHNNNNNSLLRLVVAMDSSKDHLMVTGSVSIGGIFGNDDQLLDKQCLPSVLEFSSPSFLLLLYDGGGDVGGILGHSQPLLVLCFIILCFRFAILCLFISHCVSRFVSVCLVLFVHHLF